MEKAASNFERLIKEDRAARESKVCKRSSPHDDAKALLAGLYGGGSCVDFEPVWRLMQSLCAAVRGPE